MHARHRTIYKWVHDFQLALGRSLDLDRIILVIQNQPSLLLFLPSSSFSLLLYLSLFLLQHTSPSYEGTQHTVLL